MRRVYFIFFCRKYFFNTFALKTYFSLALILGLITTVSVPSVIKNMFYLGSLDFANLSQFYKHAFTHTELVVQLIFSTSIIFGFFVLSSSVRELFSHKDADVV